MVFYNITIMRAAARLTPGLHITIYTSFSATISSLETSSPRIYHLLALPTTSSHLHNLFSSLLLPHPFLPPPFPPSPLSTAQLPSHSPTFFLLPSLIHLSPPLTLQLPHSRYKFPPQPNTRIFSNTTAPRNQRRSTTMRIRRCRD